MILGPTDYFCDLPIETTHPLTPLQYGSWGGLSGLTVMEKSSACNTNKGCTETKRDLRTVV